MRYFKKMLIAGLIGVSSLFGLAGCAPQKTQETEFIEVMQKKKGATQEEAEAAFPYAFRKQHGKQVEREGKKAYVPNYDSVSLDDRISVANQMKADLDSLLSFKDRENTKLIDSFAVRPSLEQRKAAVEYNLARLELAKLFSQFKAAMVGSSGEEILRVAGGSLGNTLSEADLSYPDGSLERKVRFDAPYVEGARASGNLKVVEAYELRNMFYIQEPNPDYPLKDPTKATRWAQKAVGLRIVGYDIGEEGSKKPKYVEVFRLLPDGTPERQPAIKVFHPLDSDDMSVAVIDSDPFGKEGHGKYDRLEKIEIESGKDLMKEHEEILQSLFKSAMHRKERPEESPMNVEIVRVGDIDLEEGLWEFSKAGFDVPFRYKLPPGGDNYHMVVCFKSQSAPSVGDSMSTTATMIPASAKVKEVKYIAKEYLNPGSDSSIDGRVVEFYKVKEQYRKVVGMEVEGKRFTIDLPDGRTETLLESRVIESVPYMKAYDHGDASRFEVWDKDGMDNPKYELRREYSPKPAELDLEKDRDAKK